MSDYFNDYEGYNPGVNPAPAAGNNPDFNRDRYPTPPVAPAPPQAPPMTPGYNSYTRPPVPPANAQYTSAPVPPQAPTLNNQPYYRPAQANVNPDASPYQPAPHPPRYSEPYSAYQPPKQPMSGGLKALLIIIISILVVSLVAFIAYVSLSRPSDNFQEPSKKNSFPIETESSNPFGGFYFNDGDEETTAPSEGNYEQSNAKDKVKKDYAGLTLNKKPASVPPEQTGAAYTFSSVQNSVVGVIAYVDGQEGSATSYTTLGSGIIVTADGYIVTNAHLLNYSRTSYLFKIITNDNKEYDAGVVGYDSRSDLAVLKIDAAGLTPAVFGDSSEIQITEDVVVVGNPLSLNYKNSVTKGIVSAVDRQVSITNNVKCIQTDAAINPGNSGGPLCNMFGQVIGITNSKIALDDYEGMGFAIPSKLIKSVADDIIRYGYVQGRVRIGVLGQVNYIGETYNTGIEIQQINENGPMDNTGAQTGDFIVKLDGEKVSNFADIYDMLEKHKAGDKVKVTVYRPGEDKEYEISVKLEADEE